MANTKKPSKVSKYRTRRVLVRLVELSALVLDYLIRVYMADKGKRPRGCDIMAFKYTFQHYIDISTSASSLTMIKIRAGGSYAMQRCRHLWSAFKYAKLGNVSIKLVPVSTLPVDPLGLSYSDDDPQTVDPRDQLNPGLVRITNGEDIVDDFTGLSETQMEQMYINTMLDPRWSKFMLQSGFKRHAVPLYWTVGQLAQDNYPGMISNLPQIKGTGDNATQFVANTNASQMFDTGNGDGNLYTATSNPVYLHRKDSDPRGLFQTGHKGRIGWLPTDAWESFTNAAGTEFNQAMIKPLLSPDLITVLLPKAHKTLYYYRMFITETVWFSGIKNYGINDTNEIEYRAIDNFMRSSALFPMDPYNAQGMNPIGCPTPMNDGYSE